MKLEERIDRKLKLNERRLLDKTRQYVRSNKRVDRDEVLELQGKIAVLKELQYEQ